MSDRRRNPDQRLLLAAAQAGDEERVPPAGRAVPARARRPLLSDARLRSRRRGPRRRRRCCGRGGRSGGSSRARSFRRGCIGSRPTRAWMSSSAAPAGRSRSIRSRTARRTRRRADVRPGGALRDPGGDGAGAAARDPGAARSPARGADLPRRARRGARPRSPSCSSRPSRRSTARYSAPARRSTSSCPATAATEAGPDERELLDRYVAAFEHDDVDGLVALLREDAVTTDAAAAVADRRAPDRAVLPRDRGRRRLCADSG